MNAKDKNGLSKQGASRVTIQWETGLIHCYTIEANYHNGRRINFLNPKLDKRSNTLVAETAITDPSSRHYLNN